MKKLIFLALFVYIFLTPFYFHPDIKTIYYLSHFLSSGVLNIYKFIAENPDKAQLGPFVYPPLTYFLFGILYFPLNLFAGAGFVGWLGMGSDAVTVDNIFRYLFLLKFPFVVIHLLTGVYIYKLVEDKSKKLTAAAIWLFNPVSIYNVALIGQFDGIPVLFTVLSLYYANQKPKFAALLLGIGGALKVYPLLLLPFLALMSSKDWKKQLSLFLIGVAPYLLSILPFLSTPAFFRDAFASGLSQRIFQTALPVGFGEQILLVPAVMLGLLFVCIHQRGRENLFGFYASLLLVVLAGIHFHPQWVLWVMPFLSIYFAKSNMKLIPILFFTSYAGIIFMFDDKFLTFGLLSPIDAGIFFLPSIAEFLRRFYDPSTIQSLSRTVFMLTAFYITWRVLKEKQYE